MPESFDSRIDAFFSYLADRKAAPEAVLTKARSFFVSPGDVRIGQIAVLKGFLAPRDVVSIVAAQADSDLRFGELAIERALMSEDQLQRALTSQGDRCLQAIELIQLNYPIRHEEIPGILSDFDPWLAARGMAELRVEADMRNARAADATKLRTALRKIKQLASLPVVVQKAIAMLESPECRLDKVSKLLEGDPPLAAQVLRLSNSAFIGLRQKVTTVQRALVILGTSNVRLVLLTATVINQFKTGRDETRAFWTQSVLAGQWGKALASRADSGVPAEEAFIGGLLADLGQLVIRQYFTNHAATIGKHVREGWPLELAERTCLGLSHADLGAYLCHCWNFPAMLQESVLYHQTPSSAVRRFNLFPLTKIVNASCRLAELAPGSQFMSGFELLDDDFLDCHAIGRSAPLQLAPQVFEDARQLVGSLLV